MIPIECLLAVSAVMLFAGIYGFLTRKSTLAILLSIELMLNAADLNFAVFNRLLFPGRDCHCRSRKCHRHCHYDQHLSSSQQSLCGSVEEDEVVTTQSKYKQWILLSLSSYFLSSPSS